MNKKDVLIFLNIFCLTFKDVEDSSVRDKLDDLRDVVARLLKDFISFQYFRRRLLSYCLFSNNTYLSRSFLKYLDRLYNVLN